MLALTIRILGCTIVDICLNTDDPADDEQVQGELSGRSVGFEWTTDTLPSVEGD